MNWTEFKAELKRLHTYLSTWVAFIASAAAAYWLQLSPAEQGQILDAIPHGRILAPALAFAAFCVARGLPQGPKQ